MAFPLNVREVFGARLNAENLEGDGQATVTVAHVGPVVLLLRASVTTGHLLLKAELGGNNVISCKAAIYDSAVGEFVSEKRVLEKGADYKELIGILGFKFPLHADGEWTNEGAAWLMNTYSIYLTDVIIEGCFLVVISGCCLKKLLKG